MNITHRICLRVCITKEFYVFLFIVPSDFIGLFNATQYAFDFSIYASYGTVVFVAQYSVNPSVTLEYLSFDIMLTSMMIGEADIIGEAGAPFLINGTGTTINVRSLNQSEYLLPITIEFLLQDSVYDVNTNITFELLSNISTVDGMTASPFASAILFITGELEYYVHIYILKS